MIKYVLLNQFCKLLTCVQHILQSILVSSISCTGGTIIVASAGNDNLLIADPSSSDWDNTITFEYDTGDIRTKYYNRGHWPATPDTDTIVVGALSNEITFEKAGFSMFGPWAPEFACF